MNQSNLEEGGIEENYENIPAERFIRNWVEPLGIVGGGLSIIFGVWSLIVASQTAPCIISSLLQILIGFLVWTLEFRHWCCGFLKNANEMMAQKPLWIRGILYIVLPILALVTSCSASKIDLGAVPIIICGVVYLVIVLYRRFLPYFNK